MTNQNGQYIFRDVEGDELRLRVEKGGFEPKEVTVHRSGPTQLSDGTISRLYKDPQNTHGNILIGHRWPNEVRFILNKTRVIDDLLFVRSNIQSNWGGMHSEGVVVLYTKNVKKAVDIFGIIAHEIAHAHQRLISPLVPASRGSQLLVFGPSGNWSNTPEAKAYAEARKKDWERFGKAKYDTIPGYTSLLENAAEFSAYYWSIGRWNRDIHSDLRRVAPNRLKWAEEWLTK